MPISRATWIMIVLALIFGLVATIPWALEQLSLTPGTIPPGWTVEAQKTVLFPHRIDSERLYTDGTPTTNYGFPIDRSAFPFDTTLDNVSIRIIDSWQDSEGCALQFEHIGERHTIYVYRPSGRTFPAELTEDLRVYIINADLPERSGEWFTAGGEKFYGFKSVTLALARRA